MAKFFAGIDAEHADFITRQHMFFVATAPDHGRINISPKGLDGCFTLLGPNRVAFLNLTGSGNETAAHLRQNGRITLMFCAFEGAPRILRLYGTGRAIHPRDGEWADLAPRFTAHEGARQIVLVEVASVNTSCGFGVPLMDFRGQRELLPAWAAKKGAEGLEAYRQEKNARSFDGLDTGLFED